jgi:hypothetical protein
MTFRDPNNTDFFRKTIDFYDCVSNYYKISDNAKLNADLSKPDINLVCFFELKEVRDHVRATHGLNYTDFVKLNPVDEKAYNNKLNAHH